MQPSQEDYEFDLPRAVSSVVGLKSIVPEDALTADVLGTERAGHGVLIGDGIVVTIGYLVTEATHVWITSHDGQVAQGHVAGYDHETGFGLVQVLGRLDLPALDIGEPSRLAIGDSVVVAGSGGLSNAVAARMIARQEFAGYWEYLLDEALFTAPSHPSWGGTALIGWDGLLHGIGSLQLQQSLPSGNRDINMMVPISLLTPIIDDLLSVGRPRHPARPWLGLYATQISDHIVAVGLASKGPARQAGLESGDIILAVDGEEISSLAEFFRGVWGLGEAGVEVPLIVHRDGRTFEVRIHSADRYDLLKRPIVH